MRTLVVHNLVSLDGFSAGPEGDLMALPFDSTDGTIGLLLSRIGKGANSSRGLPAL